MKSFKFLNYFDNIISPAICLKQAYYEALFNNLSVFSKNLYKNGSSIVKQS